jgi:hypothetical protein
MGSGWPEFPKNHFRGKPQVSFYERVAYLQQREGPFEANTSHPILLLANTAGMYNLLVSETSD